MPRSDWEKNTPNIIFSELFPGEVKTLLDIGCGLSVKSQFIPGVKSIVALDIYPPYLYRAREQAARDDIVYIIADAMELSGYFIPNSFDVVMLQDVIEHFDKRDAYAVIQQAEQIAAKAVYISTPKGYFPQDVDTWQLGGDYYQTHRSGWSVEELHRAGYLVRERPYTVANVKRVEEEGKQLGNDMIMLDAIKLIKAGSI